MIYSKMNLTAVVKIFIFWINQEGDYSGESEKRKF